MKSKSSLRLNAILLTGIVLALLLWVADALVDAYIFHEESFLQQLLTPDPYELYTRLLVGVTVISLVFYMWVAARRWEATNVRLEAELAERRRTEGVLRLSDERFQLVSYATYHAVWDWDLVADRMWWSDSLQAIFGHSAAKAGSSRTWWEERIHPEDRAKVLASLQTAIKGDDEFWAKEYRFQRADGRYAYVFDRCYMLRGERGQPLRAIGAMMDISERKEADERLRQAEDRFRTLVEQLPAITYTLALNEDQSALYVSPQIEGILGFTPAEWLADPELWGRQLHPDDRERVLALDKRSQETGEPFSAEYRILTKDGRAIWLHDESRWVRGAAGEPRFSIGFESDITSQKQAEEKLRESTERYRQMFEEAERLRHFSATIADTMAEGLLVEDTEGKMTLVNPRLATMLGYTVEELKGQPWMKIVTERELDHVREQSRLRPQGSSSSYETWLTAKDGREIPVLISAAPYDLDGKFQGTVVTLVDISERKRVEAQLQEAMQRLAESVSAMEARAIETTLLTEMSDLLQTALTFEEANAIIRDTAHRLFPAEAGGLYLVNASRNLLELALEWGDCPPLEQVFAPDDCWAVRRNGLHLSDPHTAGLACRHSAEPRTRALLCVPLAAQGEVIGILHFQRLDGASFGPVHQQLARRLAERVGLALANLRLREKLRQQSIRDPLTSLFNRRYLEETLERELQRAIRRGKPLGVIMLDLDHFKTFNDTYGHEAGDALLRELGLFLKSNIRQEDIACRYGGEEFTLILPEADLDITHKRAQHLCAEAAHLRLSLAGRPLGAVTLSLGVAVAPTHGGTGPAVLRAADTALYHAKRQGRNRVAVAE